MAESIVQLNTGSGGPKLHTFNRTIGANSVEDEVVLNGNPYLASYTVLTGNTSVATANAHAAQLMAGASLNVYVTRIEVYQSVVATTAAFARLELFRLTTAGTGGTASTPAPHDTSDAASGATFQTLPTVKGTEGAGLYIEGSMFVQTVPTGGPNSASIVFQRDWDRAKIKPIRIAAGAANGIALKVIDAVANAQVVIDIEFYEANF